MSKLEKTRHSESQIFSSKLKPKVNKCQLQAPIYNTTSCDSVVALLKLPRILEVLALRMCLHQLLETNFNFALAATFH